MSWKTDLQRVIYNAKQDVASVAGQISDWFSSITQNTIGQVGDLLRGYDVVGINVNEVENMRNAIRNYTQALEAHLDEVVIYTDTNVAYKGEYAKAITDYVAAIVVACKCITSQLNAFSDQLKEIKDAYEAQDIEMAGKIKETAAATEGQFTRYEEKY